jgi:hypothetical protein
MNKWISIEEQEPEINPEKTILVWTNYGVRLATYDLEGLKLYGMGQEKEYKDMFEVTHWMNPEPPN